MGRIKTALIKRVTNELVDLHRDSFTKNYEENKKIVGNFADIPSKKLKNIIAGYVTRLMKTTQEI